MSLTTSKTTSRSTTPNNLLNSISTNTKYPFLCSECPPPDLLFIFGKTHLLLLRVFEPDKLFIETYTNGKHWLRIGRADYLPKRQVAQESPEVQGISRGHQGYLTFRQM